ncbi:hypothetical protein ACRDNQ_06415 [Palleronia sp. KMU-117]|uniref:hypothetical protein n=1 Tax=Palleronia sp. KMU-117 TaxID=3434108 RepID=UPI003D7230BF
MTLIKNTAIALAAVATMSTAAYAGGMSEPVMEPEIIVEESTGTGGAWIVPVIVLALVAAVAMAD